MKVYYYLYEFWSNVHKVREVEVYSEDDYLVYCSGSRLNNCLTDTSFMIAIV